MTNLNEDASWPDGIYQIEQTDPVLGGPPNLAAGAGIANVQAEQLAKRTAWLKKELASVLALEIEAGVGMTGGGVIGDGLVISADVASEADALEGNSPSKLMPVLLVKQVVDSAINNLLGSAPGQLDTINELAAAIGNDPNFAATVMAAIGNAVSSTDIGYLRPGLIAQEQTAAGINGGTSVAGDNTRKLNVVIADQIGISGLSPSGVIQGLPAGEYYVSGLATSYEGRYHKARLRNLTAGTDLVLGTTGYADPTSNVGSQSFISGFFNLVDASDVSLIHYMNTGLSTYGLGYAQSSNGAAEAWSQISMWRLS